jgi:hypothetical protein
MCLPGVDRDNFTFTFTLNWHSLVGYGGSSYHTTRGHILEDSILTAHRRERFNFRVVKSVRLVPLHRSIMAGTSLPQNINVLLSVQRVIHISVTTFTNKFGNVCYSPFTVLPSYSYTYVVLPMHVHFVFADIWWSMYEVTKLKNRSYILWTSRFTPKNDLPYEGVSIRCTHYGVIFHTLFFLAGWTVWPVSYQDEF